METEMDMEEYCETPNFFAERWQAEAMRSGFIAEVAAEYELPWTDEEIAYLESL